MICRVRIKNDTHYGHFPSKTPVDRFYTYLSFIDIYSLRESIRYPKSFFNSKFLVFFNLLWRFPHPPNMIMLFKISPDDSVVFSSRYNLKQIIFSLRRHFYNYIFGFARFSLPMAIFVSFTRVFRIFKL